MPISTTIQYSNGRKKLREQFNPQLNDLIEYLHAIFKIQLSPLPASGTIDEKPATKILDCRGHFLGTQITSVMALRNKKPTTATKDESGKPIQFKEQPDQVIAYLGDVEVEYIPGDNEKFEARNFKDYHDPKLMNDAIDERISAAYSLAYLAKASGWEKIDFGHTTDPVDRYLLISACKAVDLSYGDEKIFSSSVGGVQVDPPPLKSGLFKNQNGFDLDNLTAEQEESSVLEIIKELELHLDVFYNTLDAPASTEPKKTTVTPSSTEQIETTMQKQDAGKPPEAGTASAALGFF